MPKAKNQDMDWNFPPTGGGVEGGINDPGIVTFGGAPIASLAREVIQNSMDARDSQEKPVHVAFEMRDVPKEILRGDTLSKHVESCIKHWNKDEKTRETLDKAKECLAMSNLSMLGIIDTNTTGLAGEAWRGLVKTEGASFKSSEDAGGSFGVGKSAPFTLSPLRTVCYWTAFMENGTLLEKFQGKAVLVSHEYDHGAGPVMVQKIGFLGDVDGCREITGDNIPRLFRNTEKGLAQQGTAVWVVGFEPEENRECWQRAVTKSIIISFFHAIGHGDLEILLEPMDGSDPDINQKNLKSTFAQLTGDVESDDEDQQAICNSRLYWELSCRKPPEVHTIKSLGEVKLWIGTQKDFPDRRLPNQIALIRNTGMLITDKQLRLNRIPGLDSYVAVCYFGDTEGNKLLRGMENPQHNQFEPKRLKNPDDKKKGDKALDDLRKWVREKLKEHAEMQPDSSMDDVTEVDLFVEAPGPLDDGEKVFSAAIAIERRPIRQKVRPTNEISEEENSGDDDDAGTEGGAGEGGSGGGGDGNGHGPNDGGGSGGTGTKGGSENIGRRPINLGNVRFLLKEGGRQATLSFTAPKTVNAELKVSEVGDADSISRGDLHITRITTESDDGSEEKADIPDEYPIKLVGGEFFLDLIENKRYCLHMKSETDLKAAWQIKASIPLESEA